MRSLCSAITGPSFLNHMTFLYTYVELTCHDKQMAARVLFYAQGSSNYGDSKGKK